MTVTLSLRPTLFDRGMKGFRAESGNGLDTALMAGQMNRREGRMKSPIRVVRCHRLQRELDRLAGQIGRLRRTETFEVTERLYRRHARLTRKHDGLS